MFRGFRVQEDLGFRVAISRSINMNVVTLLI